MGNVKSFCCKDTASDIDEREERSRILNDNCGASCDDLYNNSSNSVSDQDNISYGSTNNGNCSKTLEQSALDKIYQKMASNVIDVAPGESMVIQQAEFMERQRAYQSKLNQIKTPLPLKLANRLPKNVNNSFGDTTINTSNFVLGPTHLGNNYSGNHLTSGYDANNTACGSPQNSHRSQEKRRVEYEPISDDDIQLINEISSNTTKAVKNVKIEINEKVVAQFME